MNILIIDDDPSHLKLARLVLNAGGHQTNQAQAAQDVFEAVRGERPALILVDLELPGMDGLSLVRLLKADPETRSIPVVAVTSYPDRFSRTDALAAGCDAYLVKPINTRTFSGFMENVVRATCGAGQDQIPAKTETSP